MKATATACENTPESSTKTGTDINPNSCAENHGGRFVKVVDGRKQPIRGLWQRNGRFYAQLALEDATTGVKQTRRVPLVDKDNVAVQSVADAREAMERLKVQRADNNLPVLKQTPKFCDFVEDYLRHIRSGTSEKLKREATIAKESAVLARWSERLGEIRLNQIKRAHVNAFVAWRKSKGMSNRTVNLDVIIFRNLMKHAVDVGYIQVLPTLNLRPLKVAQKKRALFTPAELERLCDAAFEQRKGRDGELVAVTKNAQEFTDYIRLLAYSGARRNETLSLRWKDVDFAREQLTVGAEGDSKNSQARTVNFNKNLKRHLMAMKKRRQPDSQWLFPSPQRGEKDIHARTFRESLELARKAAKIDKVGFHDMRHLFISFCVMSGIDFMTIAKWVGHKDGGVLIGKVYGHLADTHSKAQAKRVSFEPQIVKVAA
jgi:integrase